MPHTLLDRFSAPVPRYTSYPTAPHFHGGVSADTYRGWLEAIPAGSSASLYLHVPFCDRLCWFCACHTKQTRSYEPVGRYMQALLREIETVAAIVGPKVTVGSVHLGGGSPTLVAPADLLALFDALRSAFSFAAEPEISVEIDPNDMDDARFDALAAAGMTRASLGVQDFEPRVQEAINRAQSFGTTRRVVEGVRARGVRSVNLDVLYGLPHQTVASLDATIDQVLSLAPDRIALFGYAHVPWFKKHQTMIDEAALPDARARFDQATRAAERIAAAGYACVGLDHFARSSDSMADAHARGALSRNFQGYTVDDADLLVGLGASSIGRLPQGYVQNMPATGQYERVVGQGGLAVVRGVEFTADDRMRGWVIERLMCDFGFSRAELLARFGDSARPVLREAALLAARDRDAILVRDGDFFEVSRRARPFVRSVAARFDAYLQNATTRHSAAI